MLQASNKNETEGENKVGIMDLFRYPNIRKKSLVLYIIWFSVYFVYYGLVMNLSNIGGDIYLNTVISGKIFFDIFLIHKFVYKSTKTSYLQFKPKRRI